MTVPICPQSKRTKVFELFDRHEETAHFSGIGLELTLVRQAVDRHGGTLTVESSIEAGITFSVTLPGLEG